MRDQEMPGSSPRFSKLDGILKNPQTAFWVAPGLFLLMFFILISMSAGNDFLITGKNILVHLVKNGSVLVLLSLGVALVLAAGGVDISVAGVATLSGVVFAITSQSLESVAYGITLGVLLSIVFGFFSGSVLAVLVRYFKAPPLIASWALGALWLIVSVVMANKSFSLPFADDIKRNTSSVELGFEVPWDFFHFHGMGFCLVVSFVFIVTLLLYFSNLPRRAAAVGANKDSATYAGIKVGAITGYCYMLSAILASIAGVSSALVNGSAPTTSLAGHELTAIAAAILGGTAMTGGYFRPAPVVFAGLFWGEVTLLAINLQWFNNTEFQSQFANGIYALTFILVLMLLGRNMSADVNTVHSERKTKG